MAEKTLIQRVIARVLQLKIVRAYLHYGESNGSVLADSVTYRMLFGVFAGLLVGFSVAAIWLSGNPEATAALIDAVDNFIPGLIGEDGIISEDALQLSPGISIAGAISLLGLFWAALGAIRSLRIAIRSIAGTSNTDGAFIFVMLRNFLLAVIIGAGLVATAGATILGTAGLDLVLGWFGISESSQLARVGSTLVVVLAVFIVDAFLVAMMFRVLSGTKPPVRTLLPGAIIGGIGLSVLQQLSGLFIGGATSNPLLASFASLIALLLWMNFSVQVVLIASSYIVMGIEEDENRVRAVYGATSLPQRRVRRAERLVDIATIELNAAREAEVEANAKAEEKAEAAEEKSKEKAGANA